MHHKKPWKASTVTVLASLEEINDPIKMVQKLLSTNQYFLIEDLVQYTAVCLEQLQKY